MEKIWLKHYQRGVPAEIDPTTYPSLVDLLSAVFTEFANKPAFKNYGCTLTYAEVDQLSQHIAAYLQNVLHLKKGDRVAIMMPNTLQYPVFMFAVLRAGLVVVNVNPLYTAMELTHQLRDAGAETVIVLSHFAHVLQQALPQLPVKNVIVTDLGDLFPFFKSHLFNFVVKYIKKSIPAWKIPQAISFKEVLRQGKAQTFQPPEILPDDTAYLQYTGGTTGHIKGAILSHGNLVANILQAEAWIAPSMEKGKEIIITAIPLYHIFSLTANCWVFMKYGGLNILITNPRDIAHFVTELSKVNFTILTGVNTLFNALLNNPHFAKLNFNHLKLTLGGGAAVHQAVAERWQAVTGKPLLEGYGLTETSPIVAIAPINTPTYTGNIGLPVPSTDIKICDDEGNELPINSPGELCVKGPQVMRAYWQQPKESEETFLPGGWLKTGDIATIDERGFLQIVDRKKEMILVSGFNVYPNEVENVIDGHPAVLETAVIGIPEPISGEIVKAFVVKKNPELTEQELINYCKKHLAGYKVPKQVEFRESLPKSNVGKILRRTLREEVLGSQPPQS